MSGRIKAEDIVYVREHAHIDDVVTAAGVALKSAGGGQKKGLCPFHDEKSPSFHVTPAKNYYHCFGCGAHGSAISFLMEHSGLTYVDAIEDLARSAGLVVPREERRPQDLAKQNAIIEFCIDGLEDTHSF